MAGAEVRQESFAAGELDPRLWGRDDLAIHAAGLRSCRNFFISRQGAAVSRPGTSLISKSGEGLGRSKVVPFVFSNETAFLLEFYPTASGGYLRIWKDGAAQLDGSSIPIKIPTPYGTGVDLQQLRWAQTGNLMILTHPLAAPQQLVRTDDQTWTFSPLTFDLIQPVYAIPVLAFPLPTDGNASSRARDWKWKVSQVVQLADGTKVETAGIDVTKQNDFSGLSFHPTLLPTGKAGRWELTGGNPAAIDFSVLGFVVAKNFAVLAWRVYRGRGGVFGLIPNAELPFSFETTLSTTGGSNLFIDYGDLPDVFDAPRSGDNPFQVLSSDTPPAVLRTEHPQTVTYFDNRLIFGGTFQRPDWLWCSKNNDYLNFDRRLYPTDASALFFELGVRQGQEIRGLVPGNRLLVFTSGGVWAVAGDEPLSGDPASPPLARLVSEIGSSWVSPLPHQDAVLYVRAKGTGIRDLAYSYPTGYVGNDVSSGAQHLLLGNEVQAWAFAEDPWGLVWAVLADGRMASLTYVRGLMTAWAIHDTGTDGDAFEDVCTVPEGDEDAVYLIVNRGGTRYLERMTSRILSDPKNAICLDAAVTYSGSPTTVITGLGHLEGRYVYANADGEVIGPLRVVGAPVIGAQVTLPIAASVVHVGLHFPAELELLDLPGDAVNKRISRVIWETYLSRGLWTGESSDSKLVEEKVRDVADSWGPVPLKTQPVETFIGSSWNRFGRAFLRQADPMPCTVVGVVRVADQGGR